MERLKSLSKVLESVYRLSSSVEAGWILDSNNYLIRCGVEEPVQSSSRAFYRSIGQSSVFDAAAKFESFSPSRVRKAAMFEGENKESEERYLEIWEDSRLVSVTRTDEIHGEITLSPCFGKIAWSSDEKYIAYIAEAKTPKKGSFWSTEEDVGRQNLYIESFGETIGGVKDPRIYLFNLETTEIKEVPSQSPGQLSFKPNSHQLVFVTFTEFAYKLGLNFMMNRSCSLKMYDLETEETSDIPMDSTLTGGLFPKFSPDGKYLAYFGVPKGSLSHAFCMPLILLDWENKTNKVLVDVVNKYDENFNGIYGFHNTLQSGGWLNEHTYVFHTFNRLSDKIMTVNLEGELSEVPMPYDTPRSVSILDIYNEQIMYAVSNFQNMPKVFITNPDLTSSLLFNNEFAPMSSEDEALLSILKNTNMEIIKHTKSVAESILYYTETSNPLIVVLHGGPHAPLKAGYFNDIFLKLSQNFNILICHYRGSIGFGQDFLSCLLGNIGKYDVEDCLEAIELAKKVVSPSKIIAGGGSHGGFLSGHIAASGAVDASYIINGAVNVRFNAFTSDITDWGYAEVKNSDISLPPTHQDLDDFFQASPVAHIDRINIPVLIVAGGSDQRVNPYQSLEFYKLLKGLGKNVKMFWYEKDGHALATKSTEYDFVVNELGWIIETLNS